MYVLTNIVEWHPQIASTCCLCAASIPGLSLRFPQKVYGVETWCWFRLRVLQFCQHRCSMGRTDWPFEPTASEVNRKTGCALATNAPGMRRRSKWPRVRTYASHFGAAEHTHVPPIMMFTRGLLGFDPQPNFKYMPKADASR